MPQRDREALSLKVGSVFTPASPVSEETLFAGRIEQLRRILDAVQQKGQHAIVFGQRGVGKTSLSYIISKKIRRPDNHHVTPRINCDSDDTFSTIWRKVFSEIDMIRETRPVGFQLSIYEESLKAADLVPQNVTPDEVRRMLSLLAETSLVIVVIDEFDRVADSAARRAMADTVKSLSDNLVGATLVLVGVGESVDGLIGEHPSIDRALVQVKMPRMSRSEVHQILENGVNILGMTIADDAKAHVGILSQGLPHYAHLLGLHSSRVAIDCHDLNISINHVEAAIRKAVEDVQQSLAAAYMTAVAVHRKGNIYSDVLLACALAKTNTFGYFTATDVKDQLCGITEKQYDIPSFARHLEDFCSPSRGRVITSKGDPRKKTYRFFNPLMQPHVIMHGLVNGKIDRAQLERVALFTY
jgi:Cdc6-like AAA superfamily ATPase